MPSAVAAAWKQVFRLFASVRTGIILLILLVLAAITGTIVLQRPLTDAADLQKAYTPQTLAWLDRLGLTDLYHTWWFGLLLVLFSLSITFASIERFPVVWKFFSKPYRRPEPHFRAVLPMQAEIPVLSSANPIDAAARAFHRVGLKPQRIGSNGDVSLYAERNRFSRLSAYVVHLSLLMIFAGATIGFIFGFKGYLSLTENQQTGLIDLRDGTKKDLGFQIRCDGAGQENYPDGTPKRWWSKLAVIENGRQVKYQEIEVNHPLSYKGVRFYQSGFGMTGEPAWVKLVAIPKSGGQPKEVILRPDQPLQVDAETTVAMARFIPDFIVQDNQIYARSNRPENPAILLNIVTRAGDTQEWIFPAYPEFSHPNPKSPYEFRYAEMEMGHFTGLQVSREPGQWAVWLGILLMGAGLFSAFFFVHMRYWAVALDDGRGRQVLWVGAWASKNREEVNERFQRLIAEIQNELTPATTGVEEPEPAAAGVGR